MKRRDFIRNIAISSGAILLPSALLSFAVEQKLHIVIIGDANVKYIEEFCKQNSITSFTSIGWDVEHINDFSILNDKNIEFDFYTITVNNSHPLDNSVIIPQIIKDVFKSSKHNLILSSLYRREAILSREIINWLEKKQVDYKFFGSIPMLNPRIAPWVEKLFVKHENNHRISIYDTNILLSEYGDMLFTDAIMKCDDRLVEELSAFYYG